MDICCTAKLTELMEELPPRDAGPRAGASRWWANVLQIRRRRALVLMHQGTGFAVVLWGIKQRELSLFPDLIRGALWDTLTAYGVREDVARRYLTEEGPIRPFRATAAGRGELNRLSRLIEQVAALWDERSVPERLQLPLMCRLNRRTESCPADACAALLRGRYGTEVIAQQSFLLRTTLDLERYSAERELLVPANYSFWQLHDVLQGAYHWSNTQDHAFLVPNSLNICFVVSEREAARKGCGFEGPVAWDRDAVLLDYLYPGQTFRYLYDSNDNWSMEVEVLDLREDAPHYGAVCTACSGVAPMDGVGGIAACVRLLDALHDPENPDHQEALDWVSGERELTPENISRRLS